MNDAKDFLLKREATLCEVNDHLDSQITWCELHKHYDLKRALIHAQRYNLDQIEVVQRLMQEMSHAAQL